MAIGHAERIACYAGQSRDIANLLVNRFVHFAHQFFRRDDPSRHAHAFLVTRRQFPNRVRNFLQVINDGHPMAFSTGFAGDLEAFSRAAIHVTAFATRGRCAQIAWLTSRAMVNIRVLMPGKLLVSPGEKVTENVRFGNFEVINDPDGRPLLLGKGTFGRTYQARHCYLDTIVALKIITERYVADAAVRQRFFTEARAVAKLSHPHIARLYDFGEKDGVLHYAMEFCGGGSLADHVAKKGPLSLRRTIEIAQQISGALKCAHTAGFIHRDLKPSNIMLTTPDGPLFAKLIDFGLVQPSVPGATRSFADDQSADGARFLGTPLFASPEQLREEPMDVRTDLFSLGMTLWFLTEGRAPESGSSAEIAASRLNRENYAARLPSNLPLPFREVLGRLLEKDRKNRFATQRGGPNQRRLHRPQLRCGGSGKERRDVDSACSASAVVEGCVGARSFS